MSLNGIDSLTECVPELTESCRKHTEAAEPGETPRTVQEESGAGDPELQGRGAETEEDYLSAGEGERSLHQ